MKAIIVAKYILQLLASRHIFLNIKHIEYMLYFAQGSMLQLYNKPLFKDPIIRSKYSITIESVYRQYAYYGANSIREIYTKKEIDKLISKIWNKKLDVINLVIDSLQYASTKQLSTIINNSITSIPTHSIISLHIIRDTIRKELLMKQKDTINTIEELYDLIKDRELQESIRLDNSIVEILSTDEHYKLSKQVVETLVFSLNLSSYALYSVQELLLILHSYLTVPYKQLLEYATVKLKECYKNFTLVKSQLVFESKRNNYFLPISHSLYTFLSPHFTNLQSYPLTDLLELLMNYKGE